MRFLASVKQRLAIRMLERTMSNGLDLRKLRFFPESWKLPFQRNGLDPVPELTQLRETEPVSQLAHLFGRGIWLVTGYDEVRAVLAAGNDFSNDLGQFVPQEGRDDKDQVGGLGMTDPPEPHDPAPLHHPGVHEEAAGEAGAADRGDRRRAAGRHGGGGAGGRPGS